MKGQTVIEFAIAASHVLIEIPVAEQAALDLSFVPKELDWAYVCDLYGQMPQEERDWMAEIFVRMNRLASQQNKLHLAAATLFDDVVKRLREGLSLQANFQEADAGLNKAAVDELLGIAHNLEANGMDMLLAIARRFGGIVMEPITDVTTERKPTVQ